MGKKFRNLTDELFASVTHDDFAKAMGCSVALVRQARRDEATTAYRKPPEGWEKAARRLAEAQVAHFARLVTKLTPPKG